jgi:hypothetical protein
MLILLIIIKEGNDKGKKKKEIKMWNRKVIIGAL